MNVVVTSDDGGVLATYENVTVYALNECERWLAPYEKTEDN